jgi:hypothetical protein
VTKASAEAVRLVSGVLEVADLAEAEVVAPVGAVEAVGADPPDLAVPVAEAVARAVNSVISDAAINRFTDRRRSRWRTQR